ncbi:MAG: nuclear transport factor 2 family protein [Gemmatimonadota bacterium]
MPASKRGRTARVHPGRRFSFLLLLGLVPGTVLGARTVAGQEPTGPAAVLNGYARESETRIADFFGAPFLDSVAVQVVRDRAAFDSTLKAMWGLSSTQCWMVAAAGARRLIVLSTEVWASQACEHDAGDPEHVRGIIAHELVHAYHGQRNPSDDFAGMDDMGWFVEGLAVLASEQLRLSHAADAEAAIAAEAAPTRLADGWSGRYRYGVAGSMVAYIDRRWGRATIVRLLRATTNDEVLAVLGTNEAGFLAGWRRWVAGDWAAERHVLATVQRLWDAMHMGDGDAVRSVFAPDARLVSVATRDGRRTVELTPVAAFVEAVARGGGGWNERMYDPEVRIDGDIASVWTFYTFHRGGRFSHCGIDSFELARGPAGWVVTQVTDTRRRAGC